MANTTISDLPPASTPVAGNLLILDQEGNTKSLDLNDLFVKEGVGSETLTTLSLDGNNLVYVDEAGTPHPMIISEHLEGVSTPIGSITPSYKGEEYLDTAANIWYKSTGLVNTNWVALN